MQKNFALAGLSLLAFSLPASAYTIDANLADWGVRRTGNVSDWTPNAQVKAWITEDQTGGLSGTAISTFGGRTGRVTRHLVALLHLTLEGRDRLAIALAALVDDADDLRLALQRLADDLDAALRELHAR